VKSCHLSDFGASVLFAGNEIFLASSYVGSLCYMSAEVANKENDKYDRQKVDIWAFGILVYEILTGEKPRRSLRDIVDGIRPVLPSTANDKLLSQIFNNCTAKDPSSRPSAQELLKLCYDNRL